jgi:hypothetical protein
MKQPNFNNFISYPLLVVTTPVDGGALVDADVFKNTLVY